MLFRDVTGTGAIDFRARATVSINCLSFLVIDIAACPPLPNTVATHQENPFPRHKGDLLN
jgi:hypothetical protein